MKKFYFSFGQAHAHRVNEITWDKDVLVEITAEDTGKARDQMFDAFGPKWSMQYTEESVDFSYFPRGAIPLETKDRP